jgi:hypothetical protein
VTVAQALADLNEWTRGVIFPVLVLVIAGLLGWIARCLTNIAREFRTMRTEVKAIRRALVRAGLLPPDG